MTHDKDKYWENRKAGKRGQGEFIIKQTPPTVPDKAVIGFDNDGNMVVKNRAFRRQRLTLPNTQKKKTKRKK